MNFEFEKFKDIVKCDNVAKAKSDPRSYVSSYGANNVRDWHISAARDALNKAYELDKKIHEDNIENINFNKQQRTKIVDMMKFLGFPESYYITDPKSRARYPKRILKTSGFMEDLNKYVVLDDGFSYIENFLYKNKMSNIEKLGEELANYKISLEKSKEDEIKKKRDDIVFARLLIKYNLAEDYDWTWNDILIELTNKCKYLNLAWAMNSVRNDWNDGCELVVDALSQFTVDDSIEEDIKIYNSVNRAIEDFNDDRDGRIFRDCYSNYNVLYTMVDEDLYKDYLTVAEKCRDY